MSLDDLDDIGALDSAVESISALHGDRSLAAIILEPIVEKLAIVAQTKASVWGMLQTLKCQGGFRKFFFIGSLFFAILRLRYIASYAILERSLMTEFSVSKSSPAVIMHMLYGFADL
jgi:hypothetical protein